MSHVFMKVLNLSLNASWMILAVLLLRLFLKKVPKWISCALWGLVAIRLICPFSIESALSLVPSAQVIPETIMTDRRPVINTGIPAVNDTINPVIAESLAPTVGDGANPLQIYTAIFSRIWICGVALLVTYALVSYFLLKRKVRAAILTEGGVMVCDEIKTPFILGVLRPVIYIPSSVQGETFDMVLSHEKAHLKRGDHLWKPFGFALLAVYWFQPFCWIAYALLCRDIEAACDEKVIREKDADYIAAYSQALLDLSVTRKFITASPLAFGESGVEERVKNVLHYKKPAFWVIVCAGVLCAVLAVCFLTDPTKKLKLPDEPIQYTEVVNPGGNYIELHEEGQDRIFVPYMPAAPNMIEACIGYYSEGDEPESIIYVCSLKDLSPAEWICGSLSERVNGHMEAMIFREIHVTDIPNGFSSEYDWNKVDSSMKESESASDSVGGTGEIAITRPEINLSDPIGVDYPRLLYADSDRILFSGYFGLFVYSKSARDFITSVDLEPIGCNFTQGDNACEMFVSADGNVVYMHPMSGDEMYVYDIQKDLLKKEAFDLSGVKLHELIRNEEGDIINVWDGEDRKMTTRLSGGAHIGELGYVEYGLTSADKVIPYYPFFTPDGFSGAVDFTPEDMQDIVSADLWIPDEVAERLGLEDGKKGLLHCEDKEVLSELMEMFSGAKKLSGQTACPFATALYLTKSDGTIGWVFPATDSCDKFLSDGGCYQYADGSNEMFWKLVSRFDVLH